jgi:hypothetical protein
MQADPSASIPAARSPWTWGRSRRNGGTRPTCSRSTSFSISGPLATSSRAARMMRNCGAGSSRASADDSSMPAAITWLPRIADRSTSVSVRGICGASIGTIFRFFGLLAMLRSVWRPAATAGSSVIRPCSCRKASARPIDVGSLGIATDAPLGRPSGPCACSSTGPAARWAPAAPRPGALLLGVEGVQEGPVLEHVGVQRAIHQRGVDLDDVGELGGRDLDALASR